MEKLIEEFVDTILAAAHYETTGDYDNRGLNRNNAIELMNEILSPRDVSGTDEEVAPPNQ